MKNSEDYAKSGGGSCPFCNSDNIEGEGFDVEGGTATQELFCNNCDNSWKDQYVLVGYATIGKVNETN